MAGPVFSKEKKAQIKGELESLLSSYSGGPNQEDDNIDEQLAEIAAAPPLDFIEMNAGFEKQAKNITDSLLSFYVDLGVLDKHEYIKQKQVLDNSSIQNIFFQLKTIRMAIEKIAEEINQGNTHPRLFEVFGQLQDKLTAVVKTQANYMLFLEDTYKKVNQDISQKELGGSGTGPQARAIPQSSSDYYITAGTKNLIKEIDALEIEEDTSDSRHLTHPGRKAEVMIERGLSNVIITEDSDIDYMDDVNSLI
ncbi:hypothetical protein UFOVP1604_266 [uncultured Caudovirales phage]|uniref:Uncharacterized protein n=1 Tax=uncultured Caudovirales phage TaxID=2100421 RepID=A0A6J5SUN7_9CAUD|nr:hypothetical protein UFOVP1604_266 [uncultured Caudovirales phage]